MDGKNGVMARRVIHFTADDAQKATWRWLGITWQEPIQTPPSLNPNTEYLLWQNKTREALLPYRLLGVGAKNRTFFMTIFSVRFELFLGLLSNVTLFPNINFFLSNWRDFHFQEHFQLEISSKSDIKAENSSTLCKFHEERKGLRPMRSNADPRNEYHKRSPLSTTGIQRRNFKKSFLLAFQSK